MSMRISDSKDKKSLAVRVTFPFCPNTCQYCDISCDYGTALLMGDYCDALENELEQSCEDMDDYEVGSIYLDGAASYVKAEYVCELLDKLQSNLNVPTDVETTLRVIPGYINEFCIRDYLAAGVNRVQVDMHMGGQDRSRFTGRASIPEQEIVTMKALRHYGLNDVGIELCYGVPGQTAEEWATVLDYALSFEPAHMSVHQLSIPEGSKLAVALHNLHQAFGDRDEFKVASGDEVESLQEIAAKKLANSGMHEYLLGEFALPGEERRCLLDEAAGIDTLWLGAGGRSHIDGVCSKNIASVAGYVAAQGDIERITSRVWLAAS